MSSTVIVKLREFFTRQCLAEVAVDPTTDTVPTLLSKIALHPHLCGDLADGNNADPTRFVKRMWFVPKGLDSEGSPCAPVEIRLSQSRPEDGDPERSRTAVTLSEAFALGVSATNTSACDKEITILIEGCRTTEDALSFLYTSKCRLQSENTELRHLVERVSAKFDDACRAFAELESKHEVLKSYVLDLQGQFVTDGKGRGLTLLAQVRAKIAAGSDLNAVNKDGMALLHLAAQEGDMSALVALIDAKANVNLLNKDGLMPLHLAAQNDAEVAMEALIAAKADVDAPSRRERTRAGLGQLLLMAAQDNLHHDGTTPLHLAAEKGHVNAMKVLIAAKANVNVVHKGGATPLYSAAAHGHKAAIEALVAAKADVNLADTDGDTPLFVAAGKGYTAAINALITAKAVVNAANKIGATPLHAAAAHDHKAAIETLVAAKADVNLADKDGDTPLFVAAGKGHTEAVEALIAAKATVNAANKQGWTPMHIAAKKDHTSVVKALATAGANVNAIKRDGWTALHLAACNGQDSTVLALIKLNADMNVKNTDGHTPLYLATKNNEPISMQALIAGGAGPIQVTEADKKSFNKLAVTLLESANKLQVVRA